MQKVTISIAVLCISFHLLADNSLQKRNLPKEFSLSEKRFTVTDRVWPAKVGDADVCLWADDKMAAVTFALDDGDAPEIKWWLYQMESRGWRMTWHMIVGYADRNFSTNMFGSWADYRGISARGHEVSSHTMNHGHCSDPAPPYSCPIDTALDTAKSSCCDINYEYGQAKKEIHDSLGGSQGLTMAYSGHQVYQPYVHAGDTTWYLTYAHDPAVAAKYYIACRGVTGRPNIVNRISYTNTSCGVADDTAWIDRIIKLDPSNAYYWRGWNVSMWHNIKDSNLTIKYFNYINKRETDLWVDTYVNVAKYGEERDTKTLTVTKVTADTILFAVADSMNDTLFDFPLTVKVHIDSTWEGVSAVQGGKAVTASVVEHGGSRYALVKAVPDRGEVVLSKGPLTRTSSKIKKKPLLELLKVVPVFKEHSVSVRFVIPRSQKIVLSVYTAAGRHVERLAQGYFTAGEHTRSCNISGTGIYLINLSAKDFCESKQLVVIK